MSVVESMCHEYKRLDYACRMLVKSNDLEKTFFFNRKLHVVKNGEHQLITHLADLYDMFGLEKIDRLFIRKLNRTCFIPCDRYFGQEIITTFYNQFSTRGRTMAGARAGARTGAGEGLFSRSHRY